MRRCYVLRLSFKADSHFLHISNVKLYSFTLIHIYSTCVLFSFEVSRPSFKAESI
jgi:hypothetical protein